MIKKYLILLVIAITPAAILYAQQNTPRHMDSIEIDYQFRSNCYAFSSPANALPSRGEAHSSNIPKKVDTRFPRNGHYLTIQDNTLYLVNTTSKKIIFQAQDSRLNIIAEALNEKNEWVPISCLPGSFCGNSYHEITLDKNEYWNFDIATFKCAVKTKLRYSLITKDGENLHSNEITAFLNKGQFDPKKQEGHSPIGIMDPYSN